MIALWCTNCNEHIKVDDDVTMVFCPRCRKKINVKTFSDARNEITPVHSPEPISQSVYYAPVQKSKKKWTKIISIILASVLVFAASFAIIIKVVEPREVYSYYDGKVGKYGFCTSWGKIVLEPQFEHAYKFAPNGFAIVSDGGKYGYVNKYGELVIGLRFDFAYDFESNGLAKVRIDDHYAYINEVGRVVSEFQ